MGLGNLFIYFYLFYLREREKGTIDLLFHLLMYSFVGSWMCPNPDQTRSLGLSGWRTKPPSCLARACLGNL